MRRTGAAMIALALFAANSRSAVSATAAPSHGDDIEIAVRPSMLADGIDMLAGHAVRVLMARVVGVFEPRVFLIDSQTLLRPVLGHRARVLVFIASGTLKVSPSVLVSSSVRISGVARTLLGMQVGHEVPWPATLTRDAVDRLEIRAAVLATSVSTPEGVDLVSRSSPAFAGSR